MSGNGEGRIRFQRRVHEWMLRCFGATIASNRKERAFRFLEEALELVQAGECTKEEAHALVEYVYGRPVGDMPQEIGGVMVTLAAFSHAHGFDMETCGEVELERVWGKIEEIRRKQAAKKIRGGPLP